MRAIYRITIDNRYTYYGSAQNVKQREHIHLRELNARRHHNKWMQSLWNKGYKFKFEVVEIVLESHDLFAVEQGYLDKHFNEDTCVNLSPVAGGGVIAPVTPERIAKQIETKRKNGNLKDNRSPAQKQKALKACHQANTGAKRTLQARKRMSEAAKARRRTKEGKQHHKLLKQKAHKEQARRRSLRPEFYLVRGTTRYGPYRTYGDVPTNLLSRPSIAALYNNTKETVKGFTIER